MAGVVAGSATILVLRALGAGARYVTLVVLARGLSLAGFGRVSVILAVLVILGLPATLGMNGAALRFVPLYATGQRRLLIGFLRRSWQTVAAASVGVVVIGSLIVGLWHRSIGYPTLWILGLVAVPGYATVLLLTDTLRGLGRSRIAYLLQQACEPLLLLIAVWVLRLLGLLSAASALVANAAALSLTALVLLTVVAAQSRSGDARAGPEFRTREWLTVALPLLLTGSSLVVMSQSDVVMVGYFLGPGAAGQYAVAAQTAMLVGFVLFAVNGYIGPHVSVLSNQRRMAELQWLLNRAAHLLFWPSAALGTAIIVAGPRLLEIFGGDFTAGTTALVILVSAQVFSAGAGPVGLLLEVSGHQGISAVARGAGALLNLVLNAALIPVLGIAGAAVATTASMVFWNVWLHRAAGRRVGVGTSIVSALGRSRSS